MILQSLNAYYERKSRTGELAPEGFEPKEIPFVLVIDGEGRLVQIDDTRSGEGKKKTGRSFLVPQAVKRSVGIAANLLWDTAEYVLGFAREGGKPERVIQQHAAFKTRINELSATANDIALNAVQHFLETIDITQLEADPLWPEIRDNNPNLTFRLSGDAADTPVCLRPAVITALLAPHTHEQAEPAFCLVRGESDITARLHPSIKGVWGAQSSGANIVSFNLDAFNSFGKTQSYNAPVGEKAAFAYTTALNHLLRKGSHQRMQVADASSVFWADADSKFVDLFAALFGDIDKDDPDRGLDAMRNLLAATTNGVYREEDAETRFCVLGLAPNAARIAIRFWQVGPVRDFAKHIRQHFIDLEIACPDYETPYLSLYRLLTSIALQYKAENIPPNLAGETMRAVLAGTPYPSILLQSAIRRCRAEQKIGYQRAAIIKACINRLIRFHRNSAKELHMSLDIENLDPAYRLGRLFAALERIQNTAQPGINATIRERYYGAASSSPSSVFPVLLRLKNHHLAKIDKPGIVVWLEKLLIEIFSGIRNFPSHLDLPSQGLFAIGYYHQQQDFYSGKNKSAEVLPTEDTTKESV